jgi:acyl-[acyl-carrier-protein]-phospholipid O-acyltransferase/long-chain-fatty-acid--[acyl-carrier-protein] ligase
MLLPTAQMILIANAVFITPFLLFSSIAGQIADKFERSIIVRIIKLAEIAIILLAMHGFHNENIVILYLCVGLMGVHSTFFGPLKYSILPDHLMKDELLSANGYVEAGTFVGILLGTLLGGFYTSWESMVIFFMLFFAITGFISSMYIPKSGNAIPDLKINMNLIEESINILKHAHSKKQVFLSILGISWFWFIGAAFIAEIPMLSRDIFRADENVANMFLAVFSIGVGIGSFWCSKLFENEITAKYVPISSICLSLF